MDTLFFSKSVFRTRCFAYWTLWVISAISAQAFSGLPGDLDGDSAHSIVDLVLLIGHLQGDPPLPVELVSLADANSDGEVNSGDVTTLTDLILEANPDLLLPLSTINQTSPHDGEKHVAVTRETILRFSLPLAEDTVLSSENLYATFAGEKLLGRVELSSDRLKATLFHLEYLPSSARIRVVFDSTGVRDYLGRQIDLDGDGLAGGTALLDFDTLPITPVEGTGMVGVVYAAEQDAEGRDVPLSDVIIEVVGDEERTRTTTAADGSFTLTPVPVGSFFVNVDGRMVTGGYPDSGYYPFVRKEWEARAGRLDNPASGTGLIYLPYIVPGALQAVSLTQETVIQLPEEVLLEQPEMAGLSVIAPANVLFGDDGLRGGKIGLAPVPVDRLPEPIPAFIGATEVVTIQTDGPANFDRPLAIRFPNNPDPETGESLSPGDKSVLWSFNHDTGDWEMQGPMTVSPDGKWIESDPGVGVLQPGWHSRGRNPNTTINQKPPPNKRKKPPFGPCSSNQNENRRKAGACRQGAIAGVGGGILANLSCRLSSKIGFKWGSGGLPCRAPVTNPINAAELARRCEQFYIDCNFNAIGGGLRRKLRAATTSTAETQDDADRLLIDSVLDDLKSIEAYYESARGIIGDSDLDALSENQIEQLEDLQASLDLFLGGKSTEAFFLPRMIKLDQISRRLVDEFNFRRKAQGWYVAIQNETGATQRGKTNHNGSINRLPLRPETEYTLRSYFPGEAVYYELTFLSGDIGRRQNLSAPYPVEISGDADDDGLPDEAEAIIGTSSSNPDTDGDGITDGAEIDQGTDPLDDLPVATGILSTIRARGATHLCAVNDTLIASCGIYGITVFDVSAGITPVRTASIPTGGRALRTACSGNLVAAACDDAGLLIIDISDPPAAFIKHSLPFASPAKVVTTYGNLAFVGLENSTIALVDIQTGKLISVDRSLSASLADIGVKDSSLYVLTNGLLHVFEISNWTIELTESLNSPDSRFFDKLFIGDTFAYTTHGSGYNEFDITNPGQPVFRVQNTTGQAFFNDIVANGSGSMLATAGITQTGRTLINVDLYTVEEDGSNGQFVTMIPTSGRPDGITISNGLAYVAEQDRGVSVINYLPFDVAAMAPEITLSTNADNGTQMEEGQTYRVAASVTDDVQVRSVEFRMNGERLITDGSFPFETAIVVPRIDSGVDSLTLQAIARDTGGNQAVSESISIQIVPDSTPPSIIRTLPGDRAIIGESGSVVVIMNEPVLDQSLSVNSAFVESTGPDNTFDGPNIGYDAEFSMLETINGFTLSFEEPLTEGTYRLVIQDPLSDVAGNIVSEPVVIQFRIYGFIDTDQDGIPDSLEAELGLDPVNPDSDGDLVPDGEEDKDMDGLNNAGEVILGLDPTNPDSNEDGTQDGNEDGDFDKLTNAEEMNAGTDPLSVDTDADGWSDEAEVTTGSDPLDSRSTPLNQVGTAFLTGNANAVFRRNIDGFNLPEQGIKVLRFNNSTSQDNGFTTAVPPVEVYRQELSTDADSLLIIATPQVTIDTQ